jgi:hypothetical protein
MLMISSDVVVQIGPSCTRSGIILIPSVDLKRGKSVS